MMPPPSASIGTPDSRTAAEAAPLFTPEQEARIAEIAIDARGNVSGVPFTPEQREELTRLAHQTIQVAEERAMSSSRRRG